MNSDVEFYTNLAAHPIFNNLGFAQKAETAAMQAEAMAYNNAGVQLDIQVNGSSHPADRYAVRQAAYETENGFTPELEMSMERMKALFEEPSETRRERISRFETRVGLVQDYKLATRAVIDDFGRARRAEVLPQHINRILNANGDPVRSRFFIDTARNALINTTPDQIEGIEVKFATGSQLKTFKLSDILKVENGKLMSVVRPGEEIDDAFLIAMFKQNADNQAFTSSMSGVLNQYRPQIDNFINDMTQEDWFRSLEPINSSEFIPTNITRVLGAGAGLYAGRRSIKLRTINITRRAGRAMSNSATLTKIGFNSFRALKAIKTAGVVGAGALALLGGAAFLPILGGVAVGFLVGEAIFHAFDKATGMGGGEGSWLISSAGKATSAVLDFIGVGSLGNFFGGGLFGGSNSATQSLRDS